jgi:hypothetical protein
VARVAGDTMTAVAGDAMMAITWWLRLFPFLFSLNKCLSSVTSSTQQKFSQCPTFDTRQSSLHRVLRPQVLFASATLGIYFATVFYAAFSEYSIVVAQL